MCETEDEHDQPHREEGIAGGDAHCQEHDAGGEHQRRSGRRGQLDALVIGSVVVVIHAAERALERNEMRIFSFFLATTIALGIAFLVLTGLEWYELITEHHLTIGRNLFGTTYYTLVGFHGLHVTIGVIAMLIVLGLALRRQISSANRTGVTLVAWYWHFVDGVWIVVFAVVYLVGR